MKTDNLYFFYKGRVALFALLKAAGVRKDDEVILPGFTCVVVPNAIKYLGARPVYVDINEKDYNIDIKKIKKKITKKTRVIIAQHTFGIPADMAEIMSLARKNNIFVIEDSAHAIGSRYKGREVGTLGDAAFFSSQWSKPITTGFGGFCMVNHKRLKAKMKDVIEEFERPNMKERLMLHLQYLAFTWLFKPFTYWILITIYRRLYSSGMISGSSDRCELDMKRPDRYALQMSSFQKRLLIKKLKTIDPVIRHRKKISRLYEKVLKGKNFDLVKPSSVKDVTYLRFPLLVKDKEKILGKARKHRIEIGDWFVSPLHPVLHNLSRLDYKKGMCPVAEKVCRHIINLPTHALVNERTARKVLQLVTNEIS
ncbi:MAG: aminotransferase class I/II-fold pyridoxal phosphate-dependent enzyme [Spirochaetes bacterium]|nr:aminotransferase class I/II-fold pyridoxal phosphate-dependent enzyme [Spirochaetota bacterium]